jgi:hypothetical protein
MGGLFLETPGLKTARRRGRQIAREIFPRPIFSPKAMLMTSSQILAAVAIHGSVIISCAAAAAAALPKPKPGTWYSVLRGIVDLLACNFGNARNVQ